MLATLACGVAIAAAASSPAAVGVGHSGWFSGSPLPQGNDLHAVEMVGSRGYAAGGFGTVLRTDDAGATWTGLPSGTTVGLADLDVIGPDTVIAGAGCSLRRSDDAGNSFRRLPFTASDDRCSAQIRSFDFATADAGYILLADGTVLRTGDGGRTFSQGTAIPGTGATGGGGAEATDIAFTSPQNGYAVTAEGAGGGRVYRTTDAADSWTLVSNAPRGLRGVHFPTATAGYAVGDSSTLIATDDGGGTWSVRTLAGAPSDVPLTDLRCSGAAECLIATGPGDRLLRTGDGGATAASISPSTRKVFAAAYATATRVVAVGSGGETVVSDTGGVTFTPIGGVLPGSYDRLRATSTTTAYAPGADGRIARTTDGGQTWAAIGVSTADDIVDVSFPTPQVGYAVDSAGTALRTDNGGSSWRILDSGSRARPRAIRALGERQVLLIGPRGIRRSTNGGEGFTAVRSRAVRRAALDDVDVERGLIFAWGTRRLAVSRGGSRWTRLRKPRGRIGEVDFVSAKVGYLLRTDGRLFFTRNRGRRWREVSGIGSFTARDLAFTSARRGFLAADVGDADGSGVLRTVDGGRSWQPQLISPGAIVDLAASGAEHGFVLDGASRLFATSTGGRAGDRSSLTLRPSSRRVRRGRRVAIRGRLRPADGGELITVAQRNGRRWIRRTVRAASNGSFTTRWRLRRSTVFVAQWRGDDAHQGEGTRALRVRVVRRRR
jgi:photosystem II stability/assembly factor-like uncharacterized protein